MSYANPHVVRFPLSIRYLNAETAEQFGGFGVAGSAGWYVVNAGHNYRARYDPLIDRTVCVLESISPFVVSNCCATMGAAYEAHDRLCDEWDALAAAREANDE